MDLARSAAGVAKTFDVAFMGLAGTCHQAAAEELGVKFIAGELPSSEPGRHPNLLFMFTCVLGQTFMPVWEQNGLQTLIIAPRASFSSRSTFYMFGRSSEAYRRTGSSVIFLGSTSNPR
jgi:hypothetical protein